MKYSVVISEKDKIKSIIECGDNFGFAKKKFHEIEKLYEEDLVDVSLYEGATLLLRTSKE